MICWWCYWGWPRPIYDIYAKALEMAGGNSSALEYGPAHIVWADENFEDSHVGWCLEHFDDNADDLTEIEKKAVRWSLEELLKVPGKYKMEPEGYEDDDENPQGYPPPDGWKMVRH